MVDRIGQQLGNYRLIRLLGQGGFADVYLAEHVHLETMAAVKILSTRLTGDNVEHFRTEARTVARLIHPHIVRVLDFGVEGDTPYLAMDYASHGTLRQRHPKGTRLPLTTIVAYVRQAADALGYAHERKLIHRDVKPENMLLGENDRVLLSDFGIALVSQSTRYQNVQEVVGTAAYMAPEQLQGKPRRASDQYALGIVVYEWLCGDRPFRGSFTEVYSQHLFIPPPSLCQRLPGLPSIIEDVVFTALAKDPQQRFATVQAFATALEQACLPTQSSPTITGSIPTIPAPISSVPRQPTMATPPSGPPLQPTAMTPPASQLLQSNSITPTTGGTQSVPYQLPRRTLVLGLVGLVAVTSGLTWYVVSRSSSGLALSSNQNASATQKTTPTPENRPARGTTFYSDHTHPINIRVLSWSPDGKHIAAGSDDYTASVLDAATGNTITRYRGHSSYVEGVAWSPDSQRVASGSADGTVQIWNSISGNLIYTYRGHNGIWVNRVSWSPNGKYIASGDQSSVPGKAVTVRVWDANTGNTIVTYQGHTNGVFSVAWAPDSIHIASCGYDGTLQVWDGSTGNAVSIYRGNAALFGLSWSPDSQHVAVGGSTSTLWVLNANTGNVVSTYNINTAAVPDVTWSRNGAYIAAGSQNQAVYILNATTGANLYTYTNPDLSGHSDALAWSPDSQRVASGGNNGSIQVWQAI